MKTPVHGLIAGATLFAGAALAEINLSDGDLPDLKISGWVDFNFVESDTENGVAGPFTSADQFELNEVEIDFMFDFGEGLTAQFDLNYVDDNNGADNDIQLEQAFITYNFLDGEDTSLSLTGGRFLSYMGWESADLVNLYQFSYGYASNVPTYQDGIRLDYASDMFAVGAALVDGVWASDDDPSDLGAEFMVSFTGVENLTVFAGYAWEEGAAGADDADFWNIWASYQIGDLLIAAEYSVSEDLGGVDTDSYLIMANYAVNDWLGFTARYSAQEREPSAGGAKTFDGDEYTLAALLTATDNLGFIIEYRHDEDDVTNDEQDVIAVEATLTF